MILSLLLVSLFLALVPALLFTVNLRLYRPPPCPSIDGKLPPVSVLIPARNEEEAIGKVVRSALLNRGIELEVVVLDDHSEDSTAAIVKEMIGTDSKLRLISKPDLPSGWCGKQHACWVLASEARNPLLLFIDADVCLASDAIARMASFLQTSGADLASGIPQQETVCLMEKMLIPLIHFILLGFLPIHWMRQNRRPAFAAGCGQVFIAKAAAYRCSGGHSVIRDTLHDGLKLPRAFRRAGLTTDLFDATDLATCRMYRSAREVCSGLVKNAGEALAAPHVIGPMTAVLLGGQVLPLALLVLGFCSWPSPWPGWQLLLALLATLAAIVPRLVAAFRFRQSFLGVALHPLSIIMLLAIQWFALVRAVNGRPSTWKGRSYAAKKIKGYG